MRLKEFATATQSKPKTPEQARLDSLKQAKERASDALKAERNRQKLQKAQKTIAQVKLSGV